MIAVWCSNASLMSSVSIIVLSVLQVCDVDPSCKYAEEYSFTLKELVSVTLCSPLYNYQCLCILLLFVIFINKIFHLVL